MSDISLYYREAVALNNILYSVSDIANAVTRFEIGYALEKAVSRNVYKLLCLVADLSYGYCSCAVSVEALIKSSNVYLNNVALTQYPFCGRYSVNDLVVDTYARRTRKSSVAEE